MNDQLPSRTDAGDDWLDDLLRADGREHRAGYLDDDGFTAGSIGAPGSGDLPAWRKPALTMRWAGRESESRLRCRRRPSMSRTRSCVVIRNGSCRTARVVWALAYTGIGAGEDCSAP
jgi:hypothetical protein